MTIPQFELSIAIFIKRLEHVFDEFVAEICDGLFRIVYNWGLVFNNTTVGRFCALQNGSVVSQVDWSGVVNNYSWRVNSINLNSDFDRAVLGVSGVVDKLEGSNEANKASESKLFHLKVKFLFKIIVSEI